MAENHIHDEDKPAVTPRKVSRFAVLALAAVVVAALAAFFLFGNENAPGPLASGGDAYSNADVQPSPSTGG